MANSFDLGPVRTFTMLRAGRKAAAVVLFGLSLLTAVGFGVLHSSASAAMSFDQLETRDPQVSAPAGTFQGLRQDGVDAFLGIPYARSPVGSLRWRTPEALPRIETVYRAQSFGDSCPQRTIVRSFAPPNDISEDCLHLNIWRPANAPDGPLPVLFWIYGGGFYIGTSATETYDGARLASRNAIVVTINYRIGRLGFLAHPALSAESPDGVSGNYGLHDVIAALQWVEDNVASFGGDADNVTIFGQSAGAVIVGTMMALPEADGLFDKAFILSGGPSLSLRHRSRNGGPGFESLETLGQRFAQALVGEEDSPDILEQMRRATPDEVLEASFASGRNLGDGTRDHLAIDGTLITEAPGQALQQGRFRSVPLLIGATADEGTAFLNAAQIDSPARYEEVMRNLLGDDAETALRLYPAGVDTDSAKAAYAEFLTDVLNCQMRLVARANAGREQSTFFYEFARVPDYAAEIGIDASHGVDLGYWFGNFAERHQLNADDRRVSDLMIGYLISFAADGDPNHEGAPHWPGFVSADGERHMEFDIVSAAQPFRRQEQCDFINPRLLNQN
ncbi:carboxylesterase family protein [Parasphingopyxis sp.]|uniref:carboxylesterase/lipase family protein n=1 Tax=Parasphingopyxis sp. TaxID=1920299 RepID=UPI0026383AB4|nr:carboxylesterase family protein [Parasphingopyxis sp.]